MQTAELKDKDFNEEEIFLINLISAIKQEIIEKTKVINNKDQFWENNGGADYRTSIILNNLSKSRIDILSKLSLAPYFGRLDFTEKGNLQKEKIYIGREGCQIFNYQIIDWRAPISKLYYSNNANSSYLTPEGVKNTHIELKRHIEICNSKLISIHDEIIPNQDTVEINRVESNEYIKTKIETRGDSKLRDIVETIQAHQDDIIREPINSILVINGVAGSGKTTIAYHRVAYLLYPKNNSQINENKIAIFGPNRLFMRYVSDLLPTLGIIFVHQSSFDDWALDNMSMTKEINGEKKRSLYVIDKSLQVFLDEKSPREKKIENWKRSKLKGDLRIKNLLDNYYCLIKQNVKKNLSEMIFKDIGSEQLEIEYSIEEIQSIFEKISDNQSQYEDQRILFKNRIKELIPKKFEDAIRKKEKNLRKTNQENVINSSFTFLNRFGSHKNSDDKKADALVAKAFSMPFLLREVQNLVGKQIDILVDKIWRPITVRDEYYFLLSNPDILTQINSNIYSKDELNLLISTKTENNFIDLEDIPPIFYLHLLVNGKPLVNFDHIVIDEAQDFSQLQFYLLSKFLNKPSMTIVGDTSQGIYGHRGISNWKLLESVLPENKIIYKSINNSYRATKEITEFSNSLLKRISKKNVQIAIPIDREGEKPRIEFVQNMTELISSIALELKKIEGLGYDNVAIISKSENQCKELFQAFRLKNIKVSMISTRDDEMLLSKGITIVPAHLSKGLEFQAVIISNASESNYDHNIEYDGRLLYVAITRALHYLTIFSIGKISRYLE